MEEKLKKREDESKLEYVKRIVYGKLKDKTIDNDYSELAPLVFDKEYSSDVARRMFYGARNVLDMIDENKINNVDDNEVLKEIQLETIEKRKERKKIQALNVELNRLLREQSKSELWWENISDTIKNMKSIEVPNLIKRENILEKDGLLIIADCHYGRECTIKGLFGEIISEYNTNIFKERMWNLLEQVIEVCNERQLTHLNLFNLGDFIDGLLRISQLNSLQLGVIDSVLEYSEFMAIWLNELSKNISIDYYQTQGNHDEVRVLTGKKGDFPHENVSKLIIEFIELRLKDNRNITIHKSETDFVYKNIMGVNVLGYHGEDKNLNNSLRYFRSFYKQPIDLLFGGHLHSQSLSTEGIGEYGDAQCIRVNGICGIDDYSVRLQKASRAGANMFIFKEGKGKTSQEDFWLN